MLAAATAIKNGAASSECRISVSCVEAGRWRAHSSSVASARHASYPQLRRRKAETLSAQPLALGAAQAEVWDDIDGRRNA